MSKILLVEDEKNIREGLSNYLSKEGMEVICAENLASAQAEWNQSIELVILDWKLPDGQGIELIKLKRQAGDQTPIIMLTARSELIDKVLGLELGANDYITKPFEPRELLARIGVQLRMISQKRSLTAASSLTINELQVDFENYKVFYQNKEKRLTLKEFELLKFLLQNPGKVYSREELLNIVWGIDQLIETRTVDIHVVSLRKKLFEQCIETVRGVGYRWVSR